MRLSLSTHRLVRTLHLWIGAWGAIAAILFGLSGFLQNHRGVLQLPQGESTEVAAEDIPVPAEARTSPQALSAWLQNSRRLDLQVQERTAGRQHDGGRNNGRWTLNGGDARITYQAQYAPGDDSLSLRTTRQSPLAVLSRLHKGIGGGIAWIILSDSFALGLCALGLSGLILWSRGRSLGKMVLSAVGAAVLVLAIVAGSAVM